MILKKWMITMGHHTGEMPKEKKRNGQNNIHTSPICSEKSPVEKYISKPLGLHKYMYLKLSPLYIRMQ